MADRERYSYIPTRLKNAAEDGHVAWSEDIFDDTIGKSQKAINEDVFAPSSGIDDRLKTIEEGVTYSGTIQTEGNPANVISGSTKVTTANSVRGAIDIKTGYFECTTGGSTAKKSVNATGYVLSNGGAMKIWMQHANTASNATLSINSTDEKPLYYNGVRAGSDNSWDAGEVLSVYYNASGTGAYYATNAQGFNKLNVDTSESDLDINDDRNNTLVRFSDGHVKTKNFDSRDLKTFVDDSENVDLDINDEEGNTLARFSDGHVKTKNFDSRDLKTSVGDEVNADLDVTDENGFVLARFSNGHIKTKNFNSEQADTEEFNIYLPSVINSYVGDTLQLFKYPITLLGDYSNYGVNLSIDTSDTSVRRLGRDLRRYFEFAPPSTGTFTVKVSVMDTRNLKILTEDSLQVNVLTPQNPQNVVNVLCIGDSEVEGVVNNSGITAVDGSNSSTRSPWTNELKDRMTTSRTATDTLPAGLGLTNIHLIGTQNAGGGRHEGYGGRTADFFLGSSSPFYKNGAIKFNTYLAQDSVYDDPTHKGVDIIYILLGGNNNSTITRDGNKLVITNPTVKSQMISLLDAINTQLRTDSSKTYYNPNLKVVLLNYYSPWIEGRGYHPNGSLEYRDNCFTAQLFLLCHEYYNEIAAMDEYKDWVSSVLLSTQVDSENAFVYFNKPKNVYMSDTEITSLECLHPNTIGYKMLGAAVMRDLLGRI